MLAIPGYDLQELLGGGQQTVVYAAHCHATGQQVAIKTIRPAWKDHPSALKLLQREARVLLGARHPRLIALQRAYVIRPPYYLVLEKLPGDSLRSLLQTRRQLPMGMAVRIARQAAEALAYLHHSGFLHGDLKPDNLRVLPTGDAVLLDLGLARRVDAHGPLESTALVGTPYYLAPELCRVPPIDHPASDVYSLGLTLFEMIAGQLPFSAQTHEEARHQHLTEVPAMLGEFCAEVPAALEKVLATVLKPAPAQRPTPGQLANQLLALEMPILRKAS